ncbi:H-2 class I histocompatibility antigen, alpha chain-like isoform X2 [Colossoma macropomum]|uniref:H-2 class I histocompatibility antigen, alpha chain-like isoform X2 n=1 Tax=Colossoma macropomum TaxID=42526 RepID=UPI001863DE8A|nr:H-2 class I histocompatibility antigen, alpha chain-like isoform X2 [Colossoma macropomum]
MKEIKESEWTAGTDKLKYNGQQLNKILNIQMKAFRHDESENHTLQWRIGCEGEKHSDGSVSVLNCTHEYAYDGQSLISYNWTSRKWSASVSQAKALEEKWNGRPVDQRCDCEHWLKMYLQYSTTDTKLTPPDVHVFVKKSVTESKKLTLTCLATGFYPKDVEITLRMCHTSLPEHLLTSSGVRPNEDETYQLRKSVEIQEDEKADYNCFVNHSSLNTPLTKQLDGKYSDCQSGLSGGVIVGVTVGGMWSLLVMLVGVIFFFLQKKRINGKRDNHHPNVIFSNAPPDVHVFVKKSVTESKKLTLTCLATGFYPKDVEITLRMCHTSLPEHLLTSSGVRPNEDETYQLRKSVEIQEDEKADYNCFVNHSSLNTPLTKQLDS